MIGAHPADMEVVHANRINSMVGSSMSLGNSPVSGVKSNHELEREKICALFPVKATCPRVSITWKLMA